MSIQGGIWNLDGKPIDRALVSALSKSMKDQGPDGDFSYVDGPIALLYRPFHTTAESRRETQPYVSCRGFVVTWDGRLDNRLDLIVDLDLDQELCPTDVEIVATAFDQWEKECFRRLVGDWSLSVWKPDEAELILACDFMAIRHIFYHPTDNALWWATDLTPIVLLSGERFEIDDDYVAGYFSRDPAGHLTPYRSISQVPPGHFVCVRDGRFLVERYWRYDALSRIRYKTDAEYESHFLHIYRQSVSRRLRSDSPILAELSGGLDSSSIVCMADTILLEEGSTTSRLDTISYYDRTEPDGDDWEYFPTIENKRQRAGVHIDGSCSNNAMSLDYSGFSALPGTLGTARRFEAERAKAIRDGGYRSMLSGIGGDEFLGGIPNPSSQLADLVLQMKPVALAKQLMAWSIVKRRPWSHLFWDALMELLSASRPRHIRDATNDAWVNGPFTQRNKSVKQLRDARELRRLWLPTRRSYAETVLLMANSMSKRDVRKTPSIEMRYPYLDRTLIEFLMSIPADQLLRPGERRSLMRRALTGIVPEQILSRRTKQFGARTPIIGLQNNVDRVHALFEQPLSARCGYINAASFLETLDAARKGKGIHLVRMLRTISFELWLRDLESRGLIIITKGSHSSYSVPDKTRPRVSKTETFPSLRTGVGEI